MSTDLLYPLLIAAGCLVLVVLVHVVTKPKPSRDDITLPVNGGPDPEGRRVPKPSDLLSWHRDHEATMLDFLDIVDGRHAPPAAKEQAGVALDAAMEQHPSPEMRAELAALRGSAAAMVAAAQRQDADALDRHRAVYQDYRSAWLDRLWQFPVDERRIHASRRRIEDELDPAD
jgi:hypothetical protein